MDTAEYKSEYNAYILAIGPHPDDVDVGCGATLYHTSQLGKHNIIIDLTPSQMSSRGDTSLRAQEAQVAAGILGVSDRINLYMEDLGIQDDDIHRRAIAEQIRKYRPEIVMLPNFTDRHPDHEMAAMLIKNSIFVAGLSKYTTGDLAPHRPRLVLEYMIWDDFQPDVTIGLSQEDFEHKMRAIQAFGSQIETNSRAMPWIQTQANKLGRKIGYPYGEGFRLYQSNIGVSSLDYIYTRSF